LSHRAVHHHGDVVPGRIGAAARQAASRVLVEVLRGVPARRRHIDAATYRHLIVEYEQLLVMAAARRMGTVEAEFYGCGELPAPQHPECRGMEELLERAETPFEYGDAPLRLPAGKAQ